MQNLTAMFNIVVAFFRGVVVRFSKSRNTHKRAAAPQQYATDHIIAIEVREGRAAAARQMAQGAAAFSRIFCCVRAGANLPPNLETTSGEEISRPDLSLRSGRNTPFRWIFRSWKWSEPTFVSICSVRRSYCSRRILYRYKIYGLHRGTINNDLNHQDNSENGPKMRRSTTHSHTSNFQGRSHLDG